MCSTVVLLCLCMCFCHVTVYHCITLFPRDSHLVEQGKALKLKHLDLTLLTYWVKALLIDFQDEAFLPSRASFSPHFLEIKVKLKASGPSHVLELWLGVSKGMLPVKYFRSNKASFYGSRILWRS